MPYDSRTDFVPITALAAVPTLLLAIPPLPAATMAEFVALAKTKPGQIPFGSAGPGSIHHLTMAVFAARAGVEVLHVPYRGGAPMTAALLAGEIQAAFIGVPNVLEPLRTGKLKALGVSTLARLKNMPDVPTLAEQGLAGFDVAANMGLVARAGTPQSIVARLQTAVAKAIREPDIAERMNALGMVLREDGTAHYAAMIKNELDLYAAIVKEAKIRIE